MVDGLFVCRYASDMTRSFTVIGGYLRKRRHQRGLSQAVVAKRLGYGSPQFISNCERGLCSLPTEKLRLLIDIYEIPAEELIDILLEQQRSFLQHIFVDSRAKRGAERKRVPRRT